MPSCREAQTRSSTREARDSRDSVVLFERMKHERMRENEAHADMATPICWGVPQTGFLNSMF